MTLPEQGPASFAARRAGRLRAEGRAYPASDGRVDLLATRALLHAQDARQVQAVLTTAIHDLGGAVVPAHLEPDDLLGLDVSLGLSAPLLVVADPLSVAAMELRQVVPRLVEDARVALQRLPIPRPRSAAWADAPAEALPEYLAALHAANGRGVRDLVDRLVAAGVRRDALVEQVLAPAQREVGRNWYDGRWSVADEHAATSLTEMAAASLQLPEEGPLVVFAAPQGEWHTLPGRLAALAAGGVRSVFLGPGLPPSALPGYLESVRPHAIALSCTLSTNLLAAADLIAAAHAVGVPVLAGGQAFGSTGLRATALGADGWATSTALLGARLSDLTCRADLVEVPLEARLADAVSDDALLLAQDRHAAVAPWVGSQSDWERRQSLADLRWLARHAAAALACADPTVLDDLLGWLAPRQRARELPDHALPDGMRYLAEALAPETPAVAALLVAGADSLGGVSSPDR